MTLNLPWRAPTALLRPAAGHEDMIASHAGLRARPIQRRAPTQPVHSIRTLTLNGHNSFKGLQRQIDRQTDRQTDRHAHRHGHGHGHGLGHRRRHKYRQTRAYKWTDIQTNRNSHTNQAQSSQQALCIESCCQDFFNAKIWLSPTGIR
jgi:hypothetical protein